MAHGWDDGDEPWNDSKYFDMGLPVGERQELWRNARASYNQSTGKDTTLNEDLFPERTLELKSIDDVRSSRICFVATATFGNPFAPQVEDYRWLRDHVLSQFGLGRRFIDRYYSGLGEQLSHAVKSNPSLRVFSHAVLDLGSRVIEYAKRYI